MAPKLSFYKETNLKQTPIGRIPEEWEVARVEDICKVIGGGTPSTTVKEYWHGNIPFATPTDITELEDKNINFLDRTKNYITKKGLSKSSTNLLPEGSVLLTSRATIGYCAINKVSVATNQGFANLVCKERAYNLYILYLMRFMRRRLQELAGGSTYKEISRAMVRNLRIPLPPELKEQQEIAEALSTVDEAIRKTSEVIAKTERLKRGLMQELLTKGIGHKEFEQTEIGRIPKEWKVTKLGDVSEFKNGINFKREQRGDKGILTIDVLNMYGEGIYVSFANLYRVAISLKKDSDYILKPGDVLFVRSSLKQEGVGWTSLFNGWKEPVSFCGFIIRTRLKTGNILPEFLVYFLRSDLARKKLIAGSGQVAITNLTQDLLKTIKFPLPLIQEQQEIAQILSTIDKKLELEKNEKARLERIKQGLMDLLLTGKIRIQVS